MNGVTAQTRIPCLIALLLPLAGCDLKELQEGMIPQEAQIARDALDRLASLDFEALEPQLHPSLTDADNMATLRRVAAFFPSASPVEVKTVGSRTHRGAGAWQGSFTFQYEYEDRWLLASATLQRDNDGPVTIVGVHVQPIAGDLEKLNEFQLTGKSAVHYLVLLTAIAVPLFILYVLVLCIRTAVPKRKWLWIVFILFGVVRVSLDWTTGAVGFNPLGFQLFGAGFVKFGPYAPVVLTVAVPLGAILFLMRRSKWQPAEGQG